MNGIEKITARIEEDARAENEALLAQARAQAAEVTARYRAQAAAAADEILAQGRKNAQARARHLDSMAQMECRKAVLRAKQDVIEEAFQAAHRKLLDLSDAEYVAFLAGLAVKASSTGKEKLIFSPADRARVGKDVVAVANKMLEQKNTPRFRPGPIYDGVPVNPPEPASGIPGKLTLAEETRPMDGGFILSDGAVEVNCTFDTLIRLQRGPLAGEVAKALFG